MQVVLKMLFLIFSNANIKFAELRKLTWMTYTTTKTLAIINQIEFIDTKKFAKIALDENSETFVMYNATLKVSTIMSIHLLRTFQDQRSNKTTLITLK